MTAPTLQWPSCGFPETLSVRSAKSAKSPLSTPGMPRARGARSAKRASGTFGTAYSVHSQENAAGLGRAVSDVQPDTAVLPSEVPA